MVFSGIFAGVAYVYSTAQAKKRLLKDVRSTCEDVRSTSSSLGFRVFDSSDGILNPANAIWCEEKEEQLENTVQRGLSTVPCPDCA